MEPIIRNTGRIFYHGGPHFAENDFFFVESMGDNLPSPAYTFARERKKYDAKSIYVFEYVISGKGHIECGGRHYDVKAGDFYFLNRLYSHNYRSDKDDPYYKIWINAGGRLLDGVVNACGFTEGAVVVPQSETLHYFEELHETLADVDAENASARLLTCQGLLCQMLLTARDELHRHLRAKVSTAERIKDFIDSGLNYDMSLNTIVQHFYLNKSYVISIFSEKYGCTPKQYILARKMQAARSMLEEDHDTIAEIASTLHFSSSQHFSASFKKHVGVSPDAYRKEFHKK